LDWIAGGMAPQGFDLQLTRYTSRMERPEGGRGR